jgi:Domain of unknown function (DUF1902)
MDSSMKRIFFVRAHWDDEAKVWYSETDIDGLFINAKDLDEFEDVVSEFAGELVLENHWRRGEVPQEMISSTVPIILWQKPSLVRHAA